MLTNSHSDLACQLQVGIFDGCHPAASDGLLSLGQLLEKILLLLLGVALALTAAQDDTHSSQHLQGDLLNGSRRLHGLEILNVL